MAKVKQGPAERQTNPSEDHDQRLDRLFARLDAITADLCPSEFASLPDDYLENLDHYLYGTARRSR